MSISKIKVGSTEHEINAPTADKLTTNAGSATNPVYFNDGVPVKTTYTLGASVPSGAKFTDTVYTHPSYTARTGVPTADATLSFGGTFTVSQPTSDATGHVTAINSRTYTMPSDRLFTTLVPTGTSIPEDADLNTVTYLKVGRYYCSKNTTVATLTNCPCNDAFMMEVYSPLSTTIDNETTKTWVYRLRKLTTYTGTEYIQYCYAGSTAGTWTYGTWNKYYNEKHFAAGTSYTSGTKIGSITIDGDTTEYYAPTATSSQLGLVTTTSTVTSTSGLTACPIISGVPYYKDTNTTYSAATTSAAGLMSSTDKTKLNYTNIAYGTCSTDAATAAKVVTISGNTNWTLVAGSTIYVKFTNTNTAENPTLNVNSTGAKSIWYNTALITTSSLTYAGYASRIAMYVYDGTQYVFQGWSLDNNSDTKTTQTVRTTDGDFPILLRGTSAGTTTTTTTTSFGTKMTANPSTGNITATSFTGDLTGDVTGNADTATTATKLGSSTLGSTTKPIYLSSGTATACSTYAGGTKVTLNGTAKGASTASFYAPTAAGTSGNLLISSGGAPSWGNTMSLDLAFNNNIKLLSTMSDGTTREAFNPANSAGQCVVGAGNYSSNDADTSVRGKDVYIYSSAAGNANFRPYMRAGDKISINYQGAGFLTSSKTQVCFVVQTDRFRMGMSTITATSDDGFILRQDGNYTHGSGASTYVKPSSYTATDNYGGIRIDAVFSTTTNAVNNSSIGIKWLGYITLS